MSRATRWSFLVAVLALLASAGAVLLIRRLADRPPPRLVLSPPDTAFAVEVSGAVARPGVYTLAEGARVADALAAAGGPTEEADLSHINQAQRLADGQKIHIPTRGETAAAPPAALATGSSPPSSATGSGGRLNLNRATAAELEALPGIGKTLSARIIEYRTRNGNFTSVAQLRDLKLLNNATYEKVKDLLTVE